MIEKGEMPPWFYLPTHPEAKLTAEEKAQIIRGLEATVGEDGKGHGRGGGDDDD